MALPGFPWSPLAFILKTIIDESIKASTCPGFKPKPGEVPIKPFSFCHL